MATTFKDLLTSAPQDTYSAETEIIEALPAMIEATTSAALRRGFEDHPRVTQRQVERREEVCAQLGIEPEGETCNAMEGLIGESAESIDESDQGAVRDAAPIGAAQKVEKDTDEQLIQVAESEVNPAARARMDA